MSLTFDEELFEENEKVSPYKKEILNCCNRLYSTHTSIKNLDNLIASFQKKMGELKSEAEAERKRIDSLMKENSQIQLELEDFKVSYRKSTSTHVTTDLDKIPEKYKRKVTDVKVSKTEIKRDLESGEWSPDESVAKINISHNIQIKHSNDKTFK